MAHGGGQRTLEGVLPSWQKQVAAAGGRSKLVVASPKDDPVWQVPGDSRLPRPKYLFAGLQEHWGAKAHARMLEYCNLVQSLLGLDGCDSVWLTEYDSIVLGDRLPFLGSEEDCMRGFRVNTIDSRGRRVEPQFKADIYFHWPFWFSRESFFRFNAEFQKLQGCPESGLADRTTALAIERAHLRTIPTNDIAFTCNFLSSDMVLSLILALDNGVKLVHGFKNERRKDLT
jgi:hypothetical protein